MAEKILHGMPDPRRACHVRTLAEAIDAVIVQWFLDYGAELAPEIFKDVTGRTSQRVSRRTKQ